MNDQQLEFQYEWEDTFSPESLSERIAHEGTDCISTIDLAQLLFKDHAPEGIEALTTIASGKQGVALPETNASTLAAIELLRRLFSSRRCTNPADVYKLVSYFAYIDFQEHFVVISLSGSHEVIGIHEITKGLLNRTLIHPREAFVPCLLDHAAACILVHNHPGNSLEPSNDDLEVTLRLRKAGDLLGVPILDHLIISRDGYRSLAESGELL